MSTPVRFLVQPTVRAMWSSTSALSRCCHRTLTIAHSNVHRLSTLQPTYALTPTRDLSFSHRRLAAFSASPSTSTTSDESADPAAAAYRSIHSKLTSSLQPSYLHLEDTSGGCGTFFRLLIASPHFDGQSLVKQHRMVKEAIKADIGAIHGLTIDTMTVAQYTERKKAADEKRKTSVS